MVGRGGFEMDIWMLMKGYIQYTKHINILETRCAG